MNRILTNKSFEELKKHHSDLVASSDAPYKNAADALLKWSSILSTIESLQISPKTMVDLGCGQSNLCSLVDTITDSSLESILLFDVISQQQVFRKNARFRYFRGNILETTSVIENESVDLVIDSCSVTHFKTSGNVAYNDGFNEVARILNRILKPGGYFISSTDILSFESEIRGEFISPHHVISICENNGLKLASEFDFSFEDAFLLGDPAHGGGRQLAVGNFVFIKEKS